MNNLVRKQLYLDPRQEKLLKRRAKHEGVPESEVIRRAIDLGLQRMDLSKLSGRSSPDAFFSLIDKHVQKGAAPKPRDWKREELYDRRK